MKHNLNPEQLLMLCKGETVEIDGKKIHITEVTSDVIPEPQPTIQPVLERYPTWESLGVIRGYYVSSTSDTTRANTEASPRNKNVFRTEAQCKFALAAAQLSQLVHKWNEECGEEWGDYKYFIYIGWTSKELIVASYAKDQLSGCYLFTTFKTKQLAEKFIELNTPLLKDFFMLND